MLKHIVGYRHKCIFLAEHLAVLVDNGKAVNIGVNHESHISHAGGHKVGNAGEIFRDRFGGMGEVAGGGAVELDNFFYTQCLEQLRYDDTAYRVYGVNGNGEVRVADSLGIDKRESHDGVDMAAVVGSVDVYFAKFVDSSEVEVKFFGQTQHSLAFLVAEEFAVLVEKLEGVPLAGVV